MERETDILSMQVYRNTVRFCKRYKSVDRPRHIKKPGTVIRSFSAASRRRLLFQLQNSRHPLVSQFCLTYHTYLPIKQDLIKIRKRFFDAFVKRYPTVDYLWILEFQTRGFPHYHVFFSVPPNDEMRVWMAKQWNRVTGEGRAHLKFHLRPENFIPWDMGTGQYAAKYLYKSAQKSVPEGYFEGAGRFWGHSRGLVDPPQVIDGGDLTDSVPSGVCSNPIAFVARVVDRFKGKIYKQYGQKSRIRQALCAWTVPMCADIVRRVFDYINDRTNDFADRVSFDFPTDPTY